MEIIRWAKSKGWRVTAEVTPHHLLLTDELAASYDPVYKVNPPLRTRADVEALRAGLADGTIDCVATDHAPHPVEDKETEWQVAAFGMTGLETALRVVHAAMVETGLLDWAGVADRMSRAPGRDRPARRQWPASGTCCTAAHGRRAAARPPAEPGSPANLVLYDPAARSVVDPAQHASRSRNTPFAGMELPGQVLATFLRGDAHRARREAGPMTAATAPGDPGARGRHHLPRHDFGADGETFGEMVFNTGMTGYQETLTDPSYARQIVAMTAPHIGNTGVNDEDPESRRIWVSGYVVREPARLASSWRSQRSLQDELAAQGITGIAMPGTRALTRHLRDSRRDAGRDQRGRRTIQRDLLERVLASPQMTGADLASEVTTPEPYVVRPPDGTPVRYRVAAVDLGIKAATPRSMAALGCEVHVLPATATAAEILAAAPGRRVLLQRPRRPGRDRLRGRRDARRADGGQAGLRHLPRQPGARPGARPGHLQAALRPPRREPAGADVRTGKVQITSHNHGFAVALPGTDGPRDWMPGTPASSQAGGTFDTAFGPAEITHLNLNDGVVEGLRLLDAPAFSVQYHPEAAPGPHDASGLFTEFCELMEGDR